MLKSQLFQEILDKGLEPLVQRSVLFIRIPPDILFSSQSPSSLFAYIHMKQAEYIVICEKHTKEILRTSTGLIAMFQEPSIALQVGLELMSHYLCLSIDLGNGWIVDDEIWVGEARWKSERMSHLVPAQQMWVSKSFMNQVEIPDGVGAFYGNRRETMLLHFPFYEVKDYRGV